MAIKCKIWWDDTSSAYMVSCTYNERFIDALKSLIPSGDRNYDPATKFWYVQEKYGAFIRQFAQDAFGLPSVSFVSKDTTQQARTYQQAGDGAQSAYLNPSSGGTTEDAITAFFNLLPYDAAKRAYLIAAQTLHPDKPGGDGSKMIKLNELWSRIEKELYKR
jgi:hypothetical protein